MTKSCYSCVSWSQDEKKRCSNSLFSEVPWELRDPPRSAVIPKKGCELFRDKQRMIADLESPDEKHKWIFEDIRILEKKVGK